MNYVLLENIRSAYNVGNIIRTADALGWGVIITGYTPHPDRERKVIKTSLGAEQTIPLSYYETTAEAIAHYRNIGYQVFGAELGSSSITLIDPLVASVVSKYPCVIVLGNEVLGVEQETLDQVDHIIHIPMQGTKESLNVGQAAAIMMRHFGLFVLHQGRSSV